MFNMKSPCVINVIYEAKRTTEGVWSIYTTDTPPYPLLYTQNGEFMYSKYFILEHR